MADLAKTMGLAIGFACTSFEHILSL